MGNLGTVRAGNFDLDVDLVGKIFRNPTKREGTIGLVFTQQSVRTRCAFERAAHNLGMGAIHIHERRDGEPLCDFGYFVEQVCDICVSRVGDDEDFAQFIKHQSKCLTIDAGNATHPTQAIVDVFTLMEYVPIGSRVGLFGPPTNRAMKSFVDLAGRAYELVDSLQDVDAIYCVTFGNSQSLPEGLKVPILHPFPRGSVVSHSYDFGAYDLYHRQMQNSVKVREAILCAVL